MCNFKKLVECITTIKGISLLQDDAKKKIDWIKRCEFMPHIIGEATVSFNPFKKGRKHLSRNKFIWSNRETPVLMDSLPCFY